MKNQTFTPASIPVVDTLKSRYASESGSHGLNSRGQRLFGKSSIKYTQAHKHTPKEHLTEVTCKKRSNVSHKLTCFQDWRPQFKVHSHWSVSGLEKFWDHLAGHHTHWPTHLRTTTIFTFTQNANLRLYSQCQF